MTPMIEIRLLQQFAVLAEELHFGRAAARLHMTQPPLSQAIRQLEERLGVPLFVRNPRQVALSPAGAALWPEVQRLLQQVDALPAKARAAAQGQAGTLRLAFVSSIAYGPLPGWLRAFRAASPGVSLQLREATMDVQLQAFARDEIDAGFVLHAPGAVPAGLTHLTVLKEPMVAALPEGHPLARRRALRFDALAGEPLVIFPRAIAASLHDAILGHYRSRGLTPEVAQEAIQMQTIVNLVGAGMGVAWVPAALQQLQRPGVVYRQVADGPGECHTSLLLPQAAPPVVQRFVATVQGRPGDAGASASQAPRPTPPARKRQSGRSRPT